MGLLESILISFLALATTWLRHLLLTPKDQCSHREVSAESQWWAFRQSSPILAFPKPDSSCHCLLSFLPYAILRTRAQGCESREAWRCLIWIQTLSYLSKVKETGILRRNTEVCIFVFLSFSIMANLTQFVLAASFLGIFYWSQKQNKIPGRPAQTRMCLPKASS